MHHKRNNMEKRKRQHVNVYDPNIITTNAQNFTWNNDLLYSQEKGTGFLSRNCQSSKNHIVYLCWEQIFTYGRNFVKNNSITPPVRKRGQRRFYQFYTFIHLCLGIKASTLKEKHKFLHITFCCVLSIQQRFICCPLHW